MEIQPVSAAFIQSLTPAMQQLNGIKAAALPSEASQPFAFQQMLGQVVQQNIQADDEYNQKILDFASGQASDLHDVMIAGEKAGIAFQKTMAIRNKIIDAYTTVMGMQI